MKEKESVIKLKNGVELKRGEAERILEAVSKLNPDFTIPKKRLIVDSFLFFIAGPFLVAYYIVKGEGAMLFYTGIFVAISGLHGLQKYFELSKEIRYLKANMGEDMLRACIDELREHFNEKKK